ncbi:MAG TPA: hypothetical protein VK932_27925 [Kofleriaceae bacterium]|nr:hypothetical protein [Kofleriaceae bacterium]
MNLKALITTLVLGSSSVAMAHPGHAPTVRDHRAPTYQQPTYQQPAYQPVRHQAPIYRSPYQSPFYRPVWVTLGSVDDIVDGEMSFRVGRFAHDRQFTTLKLQSQGGKSLINRVQIRFANGRTQVVELNQYLTASSPSITIDLKGQQARSIAKVTVIGRNARQSAFRVLAI